MVTVTIVIRETVSAPKRELSIWVNPYELSLASEPTPVDIDWNLDNTGAPNWVFSRKGVEVKAPSSVFQDNGGSGGGKKHGWKRKVKDNKKYKYSINLENPTESTALTWDPFIVNN
jgi:hypothetical protein